MDEIKGGRNIETVAGRKRKPTSLWIVKKKNKKNEKNKKEKKKEEEKEKKKRL